MDIHQPQVLMEAYLDVYRGQEDNSDAFDQVVDFLISEGYAEDLDDAIDLIEELDEEEIEGILDEANRAEQRVGGKGLSPILVRSLRNRTYSGKTDPNVELKYDDKIMKQHPYYASKHVKGGQKSLKSHLHPRVEAHTARRGVKKVRGVKESIDIYDLVLDHLLDEGYADSEQDALQIMTNMSEEWVEEILDEASEIMTVTSPKGERRKVNRQNRRHPLAQAARKLLALQKRQALNPRAMGSRSARNQAANEFETNAKKSIYRLNADPNSERDTITPFGRAGYSLADRETHLANVRRKARARKGRD